MSSKNTFTSPAQTSLTEAPAAAPIEADLPQALADSLAPLLEVAQESSSLIASRHPVRLDGREHDINKFLLLGQRGGGQPIRLGLFAGFETGNLDTVRSLVQLLVQLRRSPSLTRDYALLAYPVVNLNGFTDTPAPLAAFERRFARESADQDVQFFLGELRRWVFNGIISLRVDANSRGFYATVRSELLAREVIEPALAAAAGALPLATQAVRVRPEDRYARAADHSHGRFIPPADVRPRPFEVELVLPRNASSEDYGNGLFVVITEILRQYRSLVAHAQDL